MAYIMCTHYNNIPNDYYFMFVYVGIYVCMCVCRFLGPTWELVSVDGLMDIFTVCMCMCVRVCECIVCTTGIK